MLKMKSLPAVDRAFANRSSAMTLLSRVFGFLWGNPPTDTHSHRAVSPELALYAEASAPEGALYIHGKPIDYLPGTIGLYVGR